MFTAEIYEILLTLIKWEWYPALDCIYELLGLNQARRSNFYYQCSFSCLTDFWRLPQHYSDFIRQVTKCTLTGKGQRKGSRCCNTSIACECWISPVTLNSAFSTTSLQLCIYTHIFFQLILFVFLESNSPFPVLLTCDQHQRKHLFVQSSNPVSVSDLSVYDLLLPQKSLK